MPALPRARTTFVPAGPEDGIPQDPELQHDLWRIGATLEKIRDCSVALPPRCCCLLNDHADRVERLLARLDEAHPKRPQKTAPDGLSPREAEILQWISRGKSNSVIADILGISRHTVDTHVRRIFRKLDTSDRTTASLRAMQLGLLRRSPAPCGPKRRSA